MKNTKRQVKQLRQWFAGKIGLHQQPIVQSSSQKLIDNIYDALCNVKEFNQLSMDRQGQISIKIVKMMNE